MKEIEGKDGETTWREVVDLDLLFIVLYVKCAGRGRRMREQKEGVKEEEEERKLGGTDGQQKEEEEEGRGS